MFPFFHCLPFTFVTKFSLCLGRLGIIFGSLGPVVANTPFCSFFSLIYPHCFSASSFLLGAGKAGTLRVAPTLEGGRAGLQADQIDIVGARNEMS